MSGGHFDYRETSINDVADAIHELIVGNHVPDEDGYVRAYPDYVIEEFKRGEKAIRRAAIYAHRIDYLVSGDDSEESFMRTLLKELGAQP